MDLLKHFTTLGNLLMGGVLVMGAVEGFVRRRSVRDLVLWLSFGVLLMALGLLNLIGFMDPEWARVTSNAAIGAWLIAASLSALFSPPSPSFPNWTKWTILVFGVGSLLAAIHTGLTYYFANG